MQGRKKCLCIVCSKKLNLVVWLFGRLNATHWIDCNISVFFCKVKNHSQKTVNMFLCASRKRLAVFVFRKPLARRVVRKKTKPIRVSVETPITFSQEQAEALIEAACTRSFEVDGTACISLLDLEMILQKGATAFDA